MCSEAPKRKESKPQSRISQSRNPGSIVSGTLLEWQQRFVLKRVDRILVSQVTLFGLIYHLRRYVISVETKLFLLFLRLISR